jgi:hypothetical protein
MKIAKRIDIGINYIFLCLLTILGIALIIDIGSILTNPNEYKTVHNFPEATLTWKSKSVLLYVLRNILFLAVLGTLFYIGYKKLVNNKSNRLKYLYYAVVLIFFLGLIWNYTQWAQTGFDH